MPYHQDRTRDASGPRPIGSVINRLLARTGYGREHAAGQLEAAWASVVPEAFRGRSRPGGVRRGVFEVVVSHSALVQEMGFHKDDLVRRLGELVPSEGIADIRCRVGEVS